MLTWIAHCRTLALAAAVLAGVLSPCAPARAADLPLLVVFPFTGNTPAEQKAGETVAAAIAAQIAAGGGFTVRVMHVEAGVPPQRTAQTAGSEYYVAGQIAATPMGTNLSVIESVVKSRTGLAIWVHNTSVRAPEDAGADGAPIRLVVVDATRSLVVGPPPTPAPPPPPKSAQPPNPIAAALGVDTPATPRPRAPASYSVMLLTGTDTSQERLFAARAIAESLRRRGVTAEIAPLPPGLDPAASLDTAGPQYCAASGSATIVGGALTTSRAPSESGPPRTTVTMALQTYDCFGHTLAAKPLNAQNVAPVWTDAIRSAADDAVTAYLGTPPLRP